MKSCTTANTGIRALYLTMLLDTMNVRMVFPILTLVFFDSQSSLFHTMTTPESQHFWYGFAIGLPHFISILFVPFICSLSDRVGRKIILFIATLGATLLAMLTGTAIILGSLSLFIIASMMQGLCARTNPIAQAAIGDTIPSEEKVTAMAYLQAAIAAGACIGPILAGHISHLYFASLNFAFPFFIAALASLIASYIVWRHFKETLLRPSSQTFLPLKQPILLFKQNETVRYLSLILFFSQIAWSFYYQYMPPILKTVLHFNSAAMGSFVGLIALWLVISTSIGIQYVKKQPHSLIHYSLYTLFAGTILTLAGTYFHVTSLLWLGTLPTATGDVLVYCAITTLYSETVTQDQQGSVMGLGYIITSLTWGVTGFLGGYLMSHHALLPLLIAPIAVIAAWIIHIRDLCAQYTSTR